MAPMPTKLQSEPIVDALCEIQFIPKVPAAQVLPGFLFSKLEGEKEVKKLSPTLPPELIAANPVLKFQPTTSLIWNKFHIRFSDNSIQIACSLPYPGWRSFSEVIMIAFEHLLSSGIVEKITRYSLKYVDFIAAETHEKRLSSISLNLVVGRTEKFHTPNFQIHVEIPSENATNLMVLASPAREHRVDLNRDNEGVLITTDSIVQNEKLPPQDQIRSNFSSLLDALHLQNKFMFFNALSNEGEASLGPVYD